MCFIVNLSPSPLALFFVVVGFLESEGGGVTLFFSYLICMWVLSLYDYLCKMWIQRRKDTLFPKKKKRTLHIAKYGHVPTFALLTSNSKLLWVGLPCLANTHFIRFYLDFNTGSQGLGESRLYTLAFPNFSIVYLYKVILVNKLTSKGTFQSLIL